MFFRFKVINTSNMQKILLPPVTKPQCSLEMSAGCSNAEDRYPEGKPKYTLLQNSILGCRGQDRTASSHKGIYGRGKETSSPPDSASLMGENMREKFPLHYQAALTWSTC